VREIGILGCLLRMVAETEGRRGAKSSFLVSCQEHAQIEHKGWVAERAPALCALQNINVCSFPVG
jgi:hypothetical protein